ncbi:hypothetical protein GF314_00095 [bacterium]|nr:hypothetical protein [bacterium]
MRSRLSWTITSLVVALLLVLTAGVRLPVPDARADRYFDEAITSAGIAYGTCRAVNAAVSVLAESDLQLEPAGVGVSLAAGQTLDPLDDLTERLADVLVTAIASLGVQKLFFELSVELVPPLLAVALVASAVLVWMPWPWARRLQRWLLRVGIVLLVARFGLPLSATVNDVVHARFFAERIATAQAELSLQTSALDDVGELRVPERGGIMGALGSGAALIGERLEAVRQAMGELTRNAGRIVANLVALTTLYAGVFVVQVILLPLGVLWLLGSLAGRLTRGDPAAVEAR